MSDVNVWQNQNNIRVNNQIKVLESIKEEPKSCSDLAKILGLSNTACEKIVDELVENDILVQMEASQEEKKKGRRPVMFKVNELLGVVCAIDLSGRDINYCIADLSNRVLAKRTIGNVFYISMDTFLKIADGIDEMLKEKEIGGKKLLSICIASPGKIDKESFDYIYAPRIEDYKNIHLVPLFKERFGCDVTVFNDTNMGIVGERNFGCIGKDKNDVFFAHIDITAGSSMVLKGQLFFGANGFAGELPDFNEIDDLSKNFKQYRFFTLTDIYIDIIRNVKNKTEHPFYGKDVLNLDDVVSLYLSNDKVVSNVIDKSARINAIEFLRLANLLDLEYVVMEGRILAFGDRYKELIEKYFKLYDANHNTCKVAFSTLNNNAIMLGSIYQAINMVFLKRFENMVVKRTNNSSYDLKEYFGNNL